MKIWSILLKIIGKVYLVTVASETFESAILAAKQKAQQEHGVEGWEYALHSCIDFDMNALKQNIKQELNIKNDTEKTKEPDMNLNWLMKTIIDGKDTQLFEVSKKYMAEPQILYINDKINTNEKA